MESLKKINNLNIYLLSSLPFALAAGPAIIEIVTFVIILIFFLSKNTLKLSKFDYLILICYFYIVLNSLFSNFIVESLSSSFFLIRFILLYYIFKFYLLSEHKSKILDLTFITICFTFIILIFDGYAQFFLEISIFGTELIGNDRMTMHFRKNELIMGSYISKIIPIFLAFWILKFKTFNFKMNLSILILFILILLCMILSNDRAATFFSIGFFLGLIILLNIKFYYKVLFLFVLIFSIVLTLISFPSVKERYIDSTLVEILGKNDDKISNNLEILRQENNKIKSLNFKIKDKNIFIFSTAHEAHIKTAINMFFHNPLIGIGPNNFRQLCAEKDYGIYEERGCSTHPHHILSQVLAELGIIGFFFYLTILIYLIKQIFKQLFSPFLNFNILCLYSFYFLILMPLLPSGNLFNNWYIYSIALPLFYLKFIK